VPSSFSSPPNPAGLILADDEAYAARDRLLASISAESDLPALGSSIARVVQLASSDDEAVRDLASFVLSDVALTQKILRLSNTVVYRSYSGAPITTVSKAIFMLGFDTVKTSAMAMLLVDGMSGHRAACVRAELAQALSASVIGREIARRSHFKDAEEAAVAALFKNMGRLLVAAHDDKLYSLIDALIESGGHTPAQASTQILGCSFDMLAEAVLSEWKIPDTIIKALNPLPQGVLKPAKTRQEWMQQVVAFSTTSTTLMPRLHGKAGDPAKREETIGKALLPRFGGALNLERESLTELFVNVEREIRTLTDQANLGGGINSSDELAEAEGETESADGGLPDELLMTVEDDSEAARSNERHASGKPVNARVHLMAGVQDVTEMMASGRGKANDLILLVLETIYRSMGFRFATVCLKDAKTDQYRARISLGEKHMARQAGFVFAGNAKRDLFQLAMEKNADLMISDASAPKIRELIPSWHRTLLPDARSFIILPLVVQQKPFGFFYADRAQAAPEGVPSDETTLIRTLKGQVVAALGAR
jgi:HD-like signal output (HDOD) protein